MPDSDPNVGIGVPIVGGVPGSGPVADPLPRTWLSLPRYAKIMGINPVHFQGAHGNNIFPLNENHCSNIWPRHAWQQSDMISHEDLTYAILDAENELSRLLGFPLAPTWVSKEVHKYPSFHRPELTTFGGRQYPTGLRKSVHTRWKKVIQSGIRSTTYIDTATTGGGSLTYLDNDGDGYAETARVQVNTTEINACEIKLYQTGTSADMRWEIRPLRSVSISGGVITILADSWLFLDPELQARHPDWNAGGFQAINVTTTANQLSSVDVYREYNDNTTATSQFYWEPTECTTCVACSLRLESGGVILLENGFDPAGSCPVCGYTIQDGCLLVRDVETGAVIPAPAEWDADNSTYVIVDYGISRDPDQVKIWYYAGAIDEQFLRGVSCEPLSQYYAQTIAYLATARLERPLCACGNVAALANHLMMDIAFSGNDTSHLVDFGILSNPLGTRMGELMAWKRVSKMGERIFDGAVV